ncbi:MAG: HAMP domain-containing histidine kinase, partial [Gammaproteobacteria bacterium]|nr:HAMP domain-containing histidine kinase [Gammaproteobacteria bacterium]
MVADNELNFSMILASSVHDMKNSLSMLLGTLEQLGGECGKTCPAAGKVNQLRYQGQRLNGDLVQLLSIYKIEHQQYTPNIEEHDLSDFLQECVNTHEPMLTPRGIVIEAVCKPGLVGYFDREMVAGVINNVVNNAYKYTKDRIRLSAATSDGYVMLSV